MTNRQIKNLKSTYLPKHFALTILPQLRIREPLKPQGHHKPKTQYYGDKIVNYEVIIYTQYTGGQALCQELG